MFGDYTNLKISHIGNASIGNLQLSNVLAAHGINKIRFLSVKLPKTIVIYLSLYLMVSLLRMMKSDRYLPGGVDVMHATDSHVGNICNCISKSNLQVI